MNQWEELQESVGFDFKDVELLNKHSHIPHM